MYSRNIKSSIILIFSLLFQYSLIAQKPLSVRDIDDIKELTKKEDFQSISVILKDNTFRIVKSNFNYNRSGYSVIAELECERDLPIIRSKKGNYFDLESKETLSILFREEEEYKTLFITQSYTYDLNSFQEYFDNWKFSKKLYWTYVGIGDPRKSERISFAKSLLGSEKTFDINSKEFGYEIGTIGSSLPPYSNKYPKVPTDSINLPLYGDQKIYGEKRRVTPVYKKLHFRNNNENFGTLCDYRCELHSPITKSEYFLFLSDTAYQFTLNMEEYYPKFSHKSDISSKSNYKTIPLIKSGKTYFLTVSIGGKKKKYVLDSGASDVTLDESTYQLLVQNGTINSDHKLPDGEYQIADGSLKKYKRTLLPEIQVDNLTVENIVSMIVPDGQPLLLGKSFLDNFKTWKIDNLKNVLIVEVH